MFAKIKIIIFFQTKFFFYFYATKIAIAIVIMWQGCSAIVNNLGAKNPILMQQKLRVQIVRRKKKIQ